MQVSDDDRFTSNVDDKGRVTIPKDLREQWRIDGNERVELAILGTESGGYTCAECGETFDLAEVVIFNRGTDDERVVCVQHLTPGDRVI